MNEGARVSEWSKEEGLRPSPVEVRGFKSHPLHKQRRHFSSVSNWRYRVIKRYKHRAIKFLLDSNSAEEKMAWQKVVAWFDSILSHHYLSANGDNRLPSSVIHIIEAEDGKIDEG